MQPFPPDPNTVDKYENMKSAIRGFSLIKIHDAEAFFPFALKLYNAVFALQH